MIDRRNPRRNHIARRLEEVDRAALLKLGFTFPKETKEDEEDGVLQPIDFPEGWTTAYTDHGMYRNLLDPQGRKRGVLGYKGAFYDRWANFYLCRRYRSENDFSQYADVPGGRPPEIEALLVKVRRQRQPTYQEMVEAADAAERQAKYRVNKKKMVVEYGYDGDPMGFLLDGELFPHRPKPIEYEDVVENHFDPYSNPSHKTLPYARAYVLDGATGTRIWQGEWYSYNDQKEREMEGWRWIEANYPNRDVLAYW